MYNYKNDQPTRATLMCGCEYCASEVDAYDDMIMSEEFEVAKWSGEKLAKKLNINDNVQYYVLPNEWRKLAYCNNIEILQEYATSTLNATIIDKTNNFIKLQHLNKITEISLAYCFIMGMHKI